MNIWQLVASLSVSCISGILPRVKEGSLVAFFFALSNILFGEDINAAWAWTTFEEHWSKCGDVATAWHAAVKLGLLGGSLDYSVGSFLLSHGSVLLARSVIGHWLRSNRYETDSEGLEHCVWSSNFKFNHHCGMNWLRANILSVRISLVLYLNWF